MDLVTGLRVWKDNIGTAHLVDKEEVDSREEVAVI